MSSSHGRQSWITCAWHNILFLNGGHLVSTDIALYIICGIICVNTIKINDVGFSENYLKCLMEKCVFLQFLPANFSMLFSILYRGRATFCHTASKAEDECAADLCGVLAQGAHQLSAKANGGNCSLLKWADTAICLRTADLSDAWLRVIDP